MDNLTVVVLGGEKEAVVTDRLRNLGPGITVKIADDLAGLEPELADARVLYHWAGSKEVMKTALLKAPKLEWIQARYAGMDGLMSAEIAASPVVVTNGSGTFSQSLGEFVICGALYFAKDLPRMLKAKAEKRWEVFDVLEIRGQTLGIVGHGDIGRAIAKRAKAMGMRVLAMRRDVAKRAGDEDVDQVFGRDQLHDMLRECDYAVVAAPLTPNTKHMMSTAEFACMKPDAIIMNVGRGPVIDETAMIQALQSKQIRGAALDVFEVEPLPADSPLWGMDNVLISAHTADHTKDWLGDAVELFVAQLARWRAGEPLINVVNKQAGY